MEQCIIAGCLNEVKLIAKSGGKSYYSCKKHEKDVAQIIVAEHTKWEMEKIKSVSSALNLKEDKNKAPKWIGF